MANYVANCPISGPLSVPKLSADVDFGGLKFDYQWGFFYTPVLENLPITLPPPFKAGP